MHYFSNSFLIKELYMFRADLLSVIRSLNPLNAELYPICHFLALLGAHHILHISRIRVNIVYEAIGICHATYVDCLLARQIPIAEYTVLRLLMMDSRSVRNM